MDVAGKHVVITGAAGGIGSAIARRMFAAGAQVVVSDVHGADSLTHELPGSVSYAADLRSEAGTNDLIDAAEAAFGPIDVFFANAGVAVGTDPMDSEATWNLAFEVNVHSHRWAARRLLPGWLERGDGYFCATASAAGLLAQIGSAPYSVSKHAAVAFAEWLAITYGDRGLKVSCLCPQGVNTAMINGPKGGLPEGAQIAGDVVRAAGRILEPEEVAEIVCQSIIDERFLILPHAEVGDYLALKGADPERWLAGMRRLQRRVTAG